MLTCSLIELVSSAEIKMFINHVMPGKAPEILCNNWEWWASILASLLAYTDHSAQISRNANSGLYQRSVCKII